jgi:hypothetical protein
MKVRLGDRFGAARSCHRAHLSQPPAPASLRSSSRCRCSAVSPVSPWKALEPSAQPAFTLKHPSLPGSWALGCVSGLFLCFLFIGLSHKKSNQLSHPEGRHATASKLFSPREEEVGATRPRRRRRRGGLRAAGLGEAVVALKPSLGRGGPCRALGRRGSPRKVPRTPTHSPQFTVCNRGGGGRGPGRGGGAAARGGS